MPISHNSVTISEKTQKLHLPSTESFYLQMERMPLLKKETAEIGLDPIVFGNVSFYDVGIQKNEKVPKYERSRYRRKRRNKTTLNSIEKPSVT